MILAEGEKEVEEEDTGEPEEEDKDETTVEDMEVVKPVKSEHIKGTQKICMDMFFSVTTNHVTQDSLTRH